MILLRQIAGHDLDALVKNLNDEKVIRYLSSRVPFPYTQKDADWFIQTGSKNGIYRAITYNGALAGVISVSPGEHEHARTAKMGYWLGRKFWGKGVATQAVCEMTKDVFSTSDIVRLSAPVYAPNKASMRVLEKNGYELDGILKKGAYKNGVFLDEHVYSLVR